ncbi:DUF5082 family protein [Olsenella sp. Marseille-P4559]|uniref:YwqH-like family protein n=1 Tax=Olsenella sp. Marseille-P4559 TaxID=2364795 RepID=UPI0010322C96|nr:DUF5082 family protein [Olsenella sp. Marseille-P4559]
MSEDKSWIQARIDDLSNAIADAQGTMAADQEKIDRLDEASRQLSDCYNTAESAKEDISGFDAGDSWAGSKRDTYDQDKDEVNDECGTYCDAILDARNQLQQKKSALSAESLNLGGLIQSWNSQISGWWDQLTN